MTTGPVFDPMGEDHFDAFPARPSNRAAAAVWVAMCALTLLGVLIGMLLWLVGVFA